MPLLSRTMPLGHAHLLHTYTYCNPCKYAAYTCITCRTRATLAAYVVNIEFTLINIILCDAPGFHFICPVISGSGESQGPVEGRFCLLQ